MVRKFYLEGRTIREISTLTGVSHQAVMQHVRNLIADREVKPRRRQR